MKGVSPILPLFFLALVVFVSGCTSGLDPQALATSNSLIKQFLAEHPNAKILATHYTAEQSKNIIDQVRKDCDNPYMDEKDYYRVVINDTQSSFYAVVWIDWQNKTIECAYKLGGDGVVIDKPKPPVNCTAHASFECYKDNLYWFDSCSNAQDKKEYCQNGCSGDTCLGECRSYAERRCYRDYVYWFDSCGNKKDEKEYCQYGCDNGFCKPAKEETCSIAGGYCIYPSYPSGHCGDGVCSENEKQVICDEVCPASPAIQEKSQISTASVTGNILGTPQDCADSDGGPNAYEKGMAKVGNVVLTDNCQLRVNWTGNYQYNLASSCSASDDCFVEEAVCDENSSYDSAKGLSHMLINCPNGCSTGACKRDCKADSDCYPPGFTPGNCGLFYTCSNGKCLEGSAACPPQDCRKICRYSCPQDCGGTTTPGSGGNNDGEGRAICEKKCATSDIRFADFWTDKETYSIGEAVRFFAKIIDNNGNPATPEQGIIIYIFAISPSTGPVGGSLIPINYNYSTSYYDYATTPVPANIDSGTWAFFATAEKNESFVTSENAYVVIKSTDSAALIPSSTVARTQYEGCINKCLLRFRLADSTALQQIAPSAAGAGGGGESAPTIKKLVQMPASTGMIVAVETTTTSTRTAYHCKAGYSASPNYFCSQGGMCCIPKIAICGNRICEPREADVCPECYPECPVTCKGGTCPQDCGVTPTEFCGSSTQGSCQNDDGCITGGCSGEVCQGKAEEPIITACVAKDCYNSDNYGLGCKCLNGKCQGTKTGQACTEDAKICPDGTSVSRTEPNCEFAPCPSTTQYFRNAYWQCYDGMARNEGGESSCKSYSIWRQYAEESCKGRCIALSAMEVPTAGGGGGGGGSTTPIKCGVNSFNVFNECSPVSGCRDSDGGINYYIQGTATASGSSLTDHCNPDGTLTEKSCSGDSISAEVYKCPYGCFEGACMQQNLTCNYNDPIKRYSAKSVEECALIKFSCNENERYFQDNCGCGCEKTCAQEGQQFSTVYKDKYPEHCCPDLTEWNSGSDTSKVENGVCIQHPELVAGSPVGTCIKCGDGICKSHETLCNCPQDCKADYSASSIHMVYPNGGETWYGGSEYNIRWETTLIPSAAEIELSYNGQYAPGGLIAKTQNNGDYRWKVPENTVPGKYSICSHFYLDATHNPRKEDCADSLINIALSSSACSDSDGGQDYYIKGTTNGLSNLQTSIISTNADQCFIVNRNSAGDFLGYTNTQNCDKNVNECALQESSCYSWSDGRQTVSTTTVSCPYGCSNGACIRLNQTCTDTDGGINYSIKGTVTSPNLVGTTIDSCCIICSGGSSYGGPWLYEYYCSGTQGQVDIHKCDFGCENGVCVSEQRPVSVVKNLTNCTDNGVDVYTWTSSGQDIAAKKYQCLDSSKLETYSCGQSELLLAISNCPNGCQDGACVQ